MMRHIFSFRLSLPGSGLLLFDHPVAWTFFGLQNAFIESFTLEPHLRLGKTSSICWFHLPARNEFVDFVDSWL